MHGFRHHALRPYHPVAKIIPTLLNRQRKPSPLSTHHRPTLPQFQPIPSLSHSLVNRVAEQGPRPHRYRRFEGGKRRYWVKAWMRVRKDRVLGWEELQRVDRLESRGTLVHLFGFSEASSRQERNIYPTEDSGKLRQSSPCFHAMCRREHNPRSRRG